jgi:hypothetical protein
MTEKILRLLFITLLWWSSSGVALACSCALLSAHDHYQNADVVFIGKAVLKTKDGMAFEIEEGFWGTNGDSITVKQYDPVICDSFAFKAGERYLVVAYRLEGELTVGPCNQGAGIAYATGDIHALRAQRDGKPLPYVYGVVVLKNGAPLVNARVTLRKQTNPKSVVLETRTGDDGYFEFGTVPPGGYIAVAKPKSGGDTIRGYFGTRGLGVRLIMYE